MSEKGRHLVETYFDLKEPLYFDYTHLVCRTALDGKMSRIIVKLNVPLIITEAVNENGS